MPRFPPTSTSSLTTSTGTIVEVVGNGYQGYQREREVLTVGGTKQQNALSEVCSSLGL